MLVKYVLKIFAIFSSLFMISFFSTNVIFGELTVLSERKGLTVFLRYRRCVTDIFSFYKVCGMSNLLKNDLAKPLPFFYPNILAWMVKIYDRNCTSVVGISYTTPHASKRCCKAGLSMYFTKITSQYAKTNICFYHTRRLRGRKYSFGCSTIKSGRPVSASGRYYCAFAKSFKFYLHRM